MMAERKRTKFMLFGSLRTKMVLGIGSILVIALGVFAYISLGSHRRAVLEAEEKKALDITDTVMKSIEYPMLDGNMAEVQIILEKLNALEDLQVVHLCDLTQTIRYSGVPDKIGSVSTSEITKKALQTNSLAWGLERWKGRKLLRHAIPIPNERACYKCHGSKEKVLGVLTLGFSWDPIEEKLKVLQNRGIVYSIICLLVMTGLVTILLHYTVITPIGSLTKATALVAKGDLSYKAPVTADDEIGHLTSSFNTMVEDLGKSRNELVNLTKFHESIVDGIRDQLSIIDPHDFKIISANKAFLRKYGPREEVIGKTCYQVTHGFTAPCKPPEHSCPLRETLRMGGDSADVHMHLDRERRKTYGEVSTFPMKDKTGTIYQVIHVERDITEKTKLEEDQREWIQALEAKTKELEEFTYIVSHDLKEPLRGITSFSQFVLEDYGDKLDKKAIGYLVDVVTNSERLKRLIDDLLTLSRLTRLEAVFLRVKASEVIEESIKRVKHSIDEKNIELVIAQDLPTIYCDKTRMVEVFGNLLSNATKFMDKENPKIEIGYQSKDGYHEFYVKDNGIGIEREYHQAIFGMFRRLHRREDYAGTGAGLHITQKIVELHGGKVWVESEPGVGTTFHFTLPKEIEK